MSFEEIIGTSYWHDSHRILFNKDCRSMSDLPDNFVQVACTSPPFWGLRKYSGLPDLIWGGDEKCEHDFNIDTPPRRNRGNLDIVDPNSKQATNFASAYDATPMKTCSLCGAWRGAYGLEPTPEMYIEHTLTFLREVRRVLRKDGVVFWNIGDSYAGSGKGQNADGSPGRSGKMQRANRGTQAGGLPISRFDKWNSDTPGSIQVSHNTPKAEYTGLKPKDLCLIPFRVAIEAQRDGWWVRSVIIWSKLNPMPESVTDRPTESHEYILMLTKSAKYYWDQEAVRVPLQPSTKTRYQYDVGFHDKRDLLPKEMWIDDRRAYSYPQKRGYKTKRDGRRSNDPELGNRNFMPIEQYHGQDINSYPDGRNLRSVWEFPTVGFPGAHFATFPEALPEICIKAATPEVGCCSKCGAPWVRILKTSKGEVTEAMKVAGCDKDGNYFGQDTKEYEDGKAQSPSDTKRRILESMSQVTQTLGWQPTCKCNADKVPSIVLDPFAGSGTTLKVAAKLGRYAIGYELSREYCQLIVDRNKQSVMRIE